MMPLYTLHCRECDQISEHLMGMETSHDLEVKCPHCAAAMTRWGNRAFWAERIQIQGDTVAGGCNYDYYDENLGVHIRSKQHRKDEMERQGVREYSPDPEMKKARDEARYIRNHAERGDIEASQARKAIHRDAHKKRQLKSIDRAFDSAPMPDLPID